MNKRQHSKFSMYASVSVFLKKNHQKFDATPIMEPLIKTYQELFDEILKVEMIAQSKITGYTNQKRHKRQALESKAMIISRALYMHLQAKGNTEDLNLLNLNKSFYQRSRDAEFYTYLNTLIDMVGSYKKSLKPFGINTPEVNLFVKDTKAFITDLHAPKEALQQRVQAKQNLILLFLQMDQLLEQKLDLVMGFYDQPNVDLFLKYKIRRRRTRTK